MKDIKKVVQVRSCLGEHCVECDEMLPSEQGSIHIKINHYLDHGYQLLCVGIEGQSLSNGQANLETIAILGKGEKVK